MQTPADDLSERRYDRAVRSGIGEALRTLFVLKEPPPKRLLELLRALDQPKGGVTSGTEERPDEELSKQSKATSVIGRDTSEEKRVEKIPGGYLVRDANGQALVYVYCRGNQSEGPQAKVLTEDEARRIAINVAKLQGLLRRGD
jgi:hypothetical protein